MLLSRLCIWFLNFSNHFGKLYKVNKKYKGKKKNKEKKIFVVTALNTVDHSVSFELILSSQYLQALLS